MKDEVSKQSDYDPALQLEAYLVGGAVRDRLLGLDSSDRDYVVVGATPAIMEKLGFKPVGRDFPVFLHPGTGDEYALARMERKTAPGYRGFTVDAAKDVTLEDDLARRDLTINAMAMTWAGEIIDPYGGQRDLRNKCLRHVSPAFAEDPVRILRVARFFARYQHLGFKVADETRALMRRISESDELDALVAERVWTETRRALDEHTPSAFFLCLRDCGALSRLFPEVDRLFGVPQTKTYHPEIDTGRHVMMALDMAARLGANTQSRFAVLCHDFGKALTPRDILPRHRGHELRGLEPLNDVCERLKVPNDYKRLARVVCREHLNLHRLTTLRAATVVKLLDNLGVFHGEDMCADFTLCCEADARGRLGREETDYPQARLLAAFAAATRRVDSAPFLARGLSGPQLGEAIRQHRIDIVAELSGQHRAP